MLFGSSPRPTLPRLLEVTLSSVFYSTMQVFIISCSVASIPPPPPNTHHHHPLRSNLASFFLQAERAGPLRQAAGSGGGGPEPEPLPHFLRAGLQAGHDLHHPPHLRPHLCILHQRQGRAKRWLPRLSPPPSPPPLVNCQILSNLALIETSQGNKDGCCHVAASG